MKVHVKRNDKDRIFIKFGWNKGTETEFIRLAKTSLFAAFEGWENTTLVYNTTTFNPRTTAAHVARIVSIAQDCGMPVSTHVKKKARDLIKKAEEETKDWKTLPSGFMQSNDKEIAVVVSDGTAGHTKHLKYRL